MNFDDMIKTANLISKISAIIETALVEDVAYISNLNSYKEEDDKLIFTFIINYATHEAFKKYHPKSMFIKINLNTPLVEKYFDSDFFLNYNIFTNDNIDFIDYIYSCINDEVKISKEHFESKFSRIYKLF